MAKILMLNYPPNLITGTQSKTEYIVQYTPWTVFDPLLLWKNLTNFLLKILTRHDKMEQVDLADILPAQITVTGLQ